MIYANALVVVAFLVFVAAMLLSQSRQRGRAYTLLDSLGPGQSSPKRALLAFVTGLGRVKSGTHEGTPYEAQYDEDSEGWASLTVRVRAPSAGQFALTKETAGERFSKAIGLSRELQTGDPSFDEEFYIETDAVPFASAFFRSPERRQAIRELCRLGFTSIRHDGTVLEAIWAPFGRSENLDPTVVTRAVAHLGRMAREVPPPLRTTAVERVATRKIKRVLAFAAPGAWAGASVLAVMTWDGSSYRPLKPIGVVDALPVTLPLAALCLGLAWALVRGRAMSHRDLWGVAVLCFVALQTSSIALVPVSNGWLDGEPETAHRVRVLRRRPENRVALESWRRPGGTEELGVSADLAARLRPPGSVLIVVTKPGRFGYEWIVRYELARE